MASSAGYIAQVAAGMARLVALAAAMIDQRLRSRQTLALAARRAHRKPQ